MSTHEKRADAPESIEPQQSAMEDLPAPAAGAEEAEDVKGGFLGRAITRANRLGLSSGYTSG